MVRDTPLATEDDAYVIEPVMAAELDGLTARLNTKVGTIKSPSTTDPQLAGEVCDHPLTMGAER